AINQPTLFDFLADPTSDQPSTSEETNPPAEPATPVGAEPLRPPDPSAPGPERASLTPPFVIAPREKAKARDTLAPAPPVRRIEPERRPATPEERQALARFAGFGPVALSIFPDPVTGHYKDATWQELGEELKALLSPEEYDSAKRTTFNAFYTSP